MERAPKGIQIRFRMGTNGSVQPSTGQRIQFTVNRGRSGSPNRHVGGARDGDREIGQGPPWDRVAESRGRGSSPTPVAFIRNPKYPKSLYDVEISMRKVAQGKPVKLTPGLSFPDPKSRNAIRNPPAPRFHHEYVPAPEDYDVISNPLFGVTSSTDELKTVYSGSGPRYISTENSDTSDSDEDMASEDDDSDDGDAPVNAISSGHDQDDTGAATAEARREELAEYAHVTQLRAHAVREAQLVEAAVVANAEPPPPFEAQPPPPKAPINPVLVLPRAVVREEEAIRELRQQSRNGANHSLNNDVFENDE